MTKGKEERAFYMQLSGFDTKLPVFAAEVNLLRCSGGLLLKNSDLEKDLVQTFVIYGRLIIEISSYLFVSL